jgi:hypothetical protein
MRRIGRLCLTLGLLLSVPGAVTGAPDCLVRLDGRALEGTLRKVTGGYRLEREGRPALFFRPSEVTAVLWGRPCSRPDAGEARPSPADREGVAERPDAAVPRTLSARSAFRGTPVSLEVVDADLRDLLETLGQMGGLNVLIAPDVQGKVTLRVKDVPWDQLLDLITRMYHLAYRVEGKVIVVASPDRLQKMYTIDP